VCVCVCEREGDGKIHYGGGMNVCVAGVSG